MFIFFTLLGFSVPLFVTSQTLSSGCPGGSVAYQDIAVVYELSYYPDNSTLTFSQQIANAISSTLFSGPTYQYFDDNGSRITQITPIPFPSTIKYNLYGYLYNYGKIRSQADLTDILNKQVSSASSSYIALTSDSNISEGLNYLNSYIQNGRRQPPVGNTIVIIAKRDSDVSASSNFADQLKEKGSKIMTIGVGNGSISGLASLSSGDGYSFQLPDITDINALNNLTASIATKLTTDCGTTWTAAPATASTSPNNGISTTTMTQAISTAGTSSTTSASSSTTPSTMMPSTTPTTTVASTTPSTTISTSTVTTPSTTVASTTSTSPTTTPRPTTTTTTAPTTSPPNPCQPGGSFINQDIALVYDLSASGDNATNAAFTNFIKNSLFSPSAYSYDYCHQIPVPFPGTQIIANVNGIPLAFSNMNTLQHFVATVNIQINLANYFNFTQSIINDALVYLMGNPLKRRFNIPENVIIVAKSASGVTQTAIDNAKTLKNSGLTIITIGIGNTDFSYLSGLATSSDYAFIIPDLNDANSVSNNVIAVSSKLVNLCATNP